MSDYTLSNKYDIDEFNQLYNFAMSLVIKNEEEADRNEDLQNSTKAFEYLDAVFKMKEFASDSERLEVINKYVEKNPYYIYLYETYNIDYATARISKDYSILKYSPDAFTNPSYISIFLELYYNSLTYFFKILYTPAFKDHEFNRNFISFIIVFMTMERFISSRMDYALDVDLFNGEQLSNMLKTFGIDTYGDLPERYQRRLIKNLNNLITSKGTNKAIVNIVGMFGFDNVRVMKHYLVKAFNTTETGQIRWDSPDLKFAKVPVETENLESAINETPLFDYEGIVVADPYWQAQRNEIIEHTFNYLDTKYQSIEVFQDLMGDGINLSYFLNTLKYLEHLCNTDPEWANMSDNLYTYSIVHSQKKLKIFDLVIALIYCVIKMYGFRDIIQTSASSIGYVYGFNYDEIIEYVLQNSKLNKIRRFDDEIGEFVDEPITKENFINTFLHNVDYKEAFSKELEQLDLTYRKYVEMRDLWYHTFSVKFNNDVFGGYTTYSEYLQESNLEMFESFQTEIDMTKDEKERFYSTHINTIASLLDAWLDSDKLDFFLTKSIFTYNTIHTYMRNVIRIFKSYTIDFTSINTVFISTSKLFNVVRLFEEHDWLITYQFPELVDLKEKIPTLDYKMNVFSNLEYIDYYIDSHRQRLVDTLKYNDKFIQLVKRHPTELLKIMEDTVTQAKLNMAENIDSDMYTDFYKLVAMILLSDEIAYKDVGVALIKFYNTNILPFEDETEGMWSYTIANGKLEGLENDEMHSSNQILPKDSCSFQDSFTIQIISQ